MSGPRATAPELDERTHRDTLVAAIADAVTTALPIYDHGMVPGDINHPVEAQRTATPPAMYAVLAIERRYTGPLRRMAGRPNRSGWRAAFHTVGTTPDEARWVRLQISNALDGLRLHVGEEISTKVEFESDTEIAVEKGKFSGSTVWTYAL